MRKKRQKKSKGVRKVRPHLKKPRQKRQHKKRASAAAIRAKTHHQKRRKATGMRHIQPRLKRIKKEKDSPIVSEPEKKSRITRNLIARTIKESAELRIGNKVEKFQVSPAFISSYIDRVLIGIEKNIPLICEQVYAKGRKTLMATATKDDVVDFFGIREHNTISEGTKKEMKTRSTTTGTGSTTASTASISSPDIQV